MSQFTDPLAEFDAKKGDPVAVDAVSRCTVLAAGLDEHGRLRQMPAFPVRDEPSRIDEFLHPGVMEMLNKMLGVDAATGKAEESAGKAEESAGKADEIATDAEVETLERMIASLKSHHEWHATELAGMKSEVIEMGTKLSAVESGLTDVKSGLADMKRELVELRSDLRSAIDDLVSMVSVAINPVRPPPASSG